MNNKILTAIAPLLLSVTLSSASCKGGGGDKPATCGGM